MTSPRRACRGDPWRECYAALTAGEVGKVMDYPPRVLTRLRLLCPGCCYYPDCYALALTPDCPCPRHHRTRAQAGNRVLLACTATWSPALATTTRDPADLPEDLCPQCREIIGAIEAGKMTSWPLTPR